MAKGKEAYETVKSIPTHRKRRDEWVTDWGAEWGTEWGTGDGDGSAALRNDNNPATAVGRGALGELRTLLFVVVVSGLRGAVGVDEARDEDGQVEDAKDGLEQRGGTDAGGDGGDAGRTQFGEGAEAEVDEVEAVGMSVEVERRCEVEGLRDAVGHGRVDAGEDETDEEVDAERAEDGLGGGLGGVEDVAGDDADDEQIEGDGEDAVDERQDSEEMLRKEEVLQDGGNGQNDDQQEQMAVEGDGPDGEQDDDRADDAEGVVAGAGGLGVGVEDDGAEQEEEEQGEAAGEGDLGESLFKGIQCGLRAV